MKKILLLFCVGSSLYGMNDAHKEVVHKSDVQQLKLEHTPYMKNIQALAEMHGSATQEILTAFSQTDAIQECLNNKQFSTLIQLLDEGIGNHFSQSALLQKMSDYVLEELLKLVLLSDFLGIEKLQDILEEALAKKIEDLWKSMPDILTSLWDRLPANIAQRMCSYINPTVLIKATLDREPDYISDHNYFSRSSHEHARIITWSLDSFEVRDCTGKLLDTIDGYYRLSNQQYLGYYKDGSFIIKNIITLKTVKTIFLETEDILDLQFELRFLDHYVLVHDTHTSTALLYDLYNTKNNPIILRALDDTYTFLTDAALSLDKKEIAIIWSSGADSLILEIYEMDGNRKSHKDVWPGSEFLPRLCVYYVTLLHEGSNFNVALHCYSHRNVGFDRLNVPSRVQIVDEGMLHYFCNDKKYAHSKKMYVEWAIPSDEGSNFVIPRNIIDTILPSELKFPIEAIYFNMQSRMLIVTSDKKQKIYNLPDLTLKEMLELTYPNK